MEKVVTKKSFIGGRMVYPGETVDVDAKGDVMPAASTPIGALTVDQLRTLLASKEAKEGKKQPEFGGNVADETKDNTRVEPLPMADVAPRSPGSTNPQVLPAGTEPHGDRFVHPAPEGSGAAIQEVVGPDAGAEGNGNADNTSGQGGSAFDHDRNGKEGGSVADQPVSLTGKNKSQLQKIAKAEGVSVADDATNAQIVEAIEAKRKG